MKLLDMSEHSEVTARTLSALRRNLRAIHQEHPAWVSLHVDDGNEYFAITALGMVAIASP